MTDYSKYAKWREKGLLDQDGIIVGCTQGVEWLMPWWWCNYRTHNSYPVVFVDFGMSEKAKSWARKKGELLTLDIPDDFVAMKDRVDPATAEKWEKAYHSTYWPIRIGWFKKPLTFVMTPFKRTIWFDLDCQIVKNVGPLFETCMNPAGLSINSTTKQNLKKELKDGLRFYDEVIYSSGVIAYQRHSPIITAWVEDTLVNNHLYIGDQHQISRIIYNANLKIGIFPPQYNYRAVEKFKAGTAVYHWVGGKGKGKIAKQIKVLFDILNIDLRFDYDKKR